MQSRDLRHKDGISSLATVQPCAPPSPGPPSGYAVRCRVRVRVGGEAIPSLLRLRALGVQKNEALYQCKLLSALSHQLASQQLALSQLLKPQSSQRVWPQLWRGFKFCILGSQAALKAGRPYSVAIATSGLMRHGGHAG